MAHLTDLSDKAETPTRLDHSEEDYIRDDAGLAIYVSGHYTLGELLYKVSLVREANALVLGPEQAAAHEAATKGL